MDVEQQIYSEEADEKLINEAFEKLLNSYLASRHRKKVDLITKAFNFAKQAHKGVRRLSGEPSISSRRPSISPNRHTKAYAVCRANRISCTPSP